MPPPPSASKPWQGRSMEIKYQGRTYPATQMAPLLHHGCVCCGMRDGFCSAWRFLGFLAGAMTALLIPARYQSQTQLMASDTQTGLGLASLMALSEKASGMGLAGDLLGLKTSG